MIIPTICTDDQLPLLRVTLTSICRAKPQSIFVVTPSDRLSSVANVAESVDKSIVVLGSNRRSKRHQILAAIPRIQADITVLVDDDVEWPGGEAFLPALIAPFEDADVGAVGTRQRVNRKDPWNAVEYLGALYIARRNQETLATSAIDGGLSCLSGRTQAIRTCIINTEQFQREYGGEKWRGQELNPDDDNFITRYCYRGGWKIRIQPDEKALVYTTLETGLKKYIAQCVRWERSRLRHTITLLTMHPSVWR